MLPRIIGALLFNLISSVAANAQFTLTANLGPQWSGGTSGNQSSLKTITSNGYFFGLEPGFHFNQKWKIQAGINYSFTGIGIQSQNQIERPLTSVRLEYLEFHPEITYHLFPKLQIGVGMVYAQKLKEFIKDKVLLAGWQRTDYIVKDHDLRATFSAAFHYYRAKVFLKYQHGLMNTSDVTFTDEFGKELGYRTASRMIQLGIGYSFFEAKKKS